MMIKNKRFKLNAQKFPIINVETFSAQSNFFALPIECRVELNLDIKLFKNFCLRKIILKLRNLFPKYSRISLWRIRIMYNRPNWARWVHDNDLMGGGRYKSQTSRILILQKIYFSDGGHLSIWRKKLKKAAA